MTHVGVICDRPDLQPLMPQFIIGNERTFLVRSIAALRAACPGNIMLVRQNSAWNNDVLCATIVRRLAAVLAPYTATVQPILFLDAVRLHTTPRVLRACATAGIWPIVVPALMTWLLQPLDTDAFLPFSSSGCANCTRARARAVRTVTWASTSFCNVCTMPSGPFYRADVGLLHLRRPDLATDSWVWRRMS